MVCANSVSPQGTCSGKVDWATAQGYCAATFGKKARLCTRKELEAGETLNSGCGYEQNLVWSSSDCNGGIYQVFGDPLRGSELI